MVKSILLYNVAFFSLFFYHSGYAECAISPNKYSESVHDTSLVWSKTKKITIKARDGEQHTGRIVDFTENLIVLWCAEEPINTNNIYKYSQLFEVTNIDSITLLADGKKKQTGLLKGAFFTGAFGAHMAHSSSGSQEGGYTALTAPLIVAIMALPGALVGHIVDVSSRTKITWPIEGDSNKIDAIQGELRKNCLISGLSRETLITFNERGEDSLRRKISSKSRNELDKFLYANKNESITGSNNVFISYSQFLTKADFGSEAVNAFITSGFNGNPTGTTRNLGTQYPVVEKRKNIFNVDLGISVTPHVRIGLSMTRNSIKIRGAGQLEESEEINATTSNVYLEYATRRLAPILKNRLEFSLAVGLSYCTIWVGRDLFDLEDSYHAYKYQYTYDKAVYGGYARVGIDLYFVKNISLPVRVEGRFVPSAHIPTFHQTKEGTSITKTLLGHTVDGSAVGVSVGLAVHF